MTKLNINYYILNKNLNESIVKFVLLNLISYNFPINL